MHIILSTDKAEFVKTIEKINQWNLALLPWVDYDAPLYSDYRSKGCEFWLGSSPDHKEWALAANPLDRDLDNEFLQSTCTAILVDPPKVQEDVIFKILFLIGNDIKKAHWITENRIQEIFNTVPFTQYLCAETYLPELPKEWLHLPVELSVDFDMSEGACVTPWLFREYRRNSLKEVLEVSYGPRHDGLLIFYHLVVREVIPLLAWDVDWPLSRRGKDAPYKREKVQGALPWEYHPDQSILTIYQWLPIRSWKMAPPYFGQPVVRLRVGGRTREEAVVNWHQCARALRKLKPGTPLNKNHRLT
jgi:hypothetical protein